MQTYHSLIKSDTLLDNNSCTVVASSLAFDQPYESMLLHYDKQGRKRGRGVETSKVRQINLALAKKYNYKSQVFNRKQVRELAGGKTMTVNNCTKYLDHTKNYIIGVRGHSVAMVEGDIQDYTEGSKRPILSLIELTIPKDKRTTCTDGELDHLFGKEKKIVHSEQNIKELEQLLEQARQLLK